MKSSKFVKWPVLVLSILFIGAQVIRPAKTNPSVEMERTIQARLQLPPQVDGILKRACYDCHSHETRWPWYSNVAPVSWFVIDHVNDGRRELNFSDWARYDARRASHKLEKIAEEVQAGEMPLESYLPMHPQARLSSEDVRTLCDWANEERTRVGYEMESHENGH